MTEEQKLMERLEELAELEGKREGSEHKGSKPVSAPMTDRQLIRNIRVEVVGMACRCDEWYSRIGKLCDRCELLRVLGDGLAEIGKTNDEPRYHSESTEMIGAKTAGEV